MKYPNSPQHSNTLRKKNTDSIAYQLFTSGTTGAPKIVRISRKYFYEYLESMFNSLELSTQDIYLGLANPSFSSSLRQLFSPLWGDATTATIEDNNKTNLEHIINKVCDMNITVIDIIPSFFQGILKFLSVNEPQKQKFITKNKTKKVTVHQNLFNH